MRILLGDYLTVKNQWELLTGDDGGWFWGFSQKGTPMRVVADGEVTLSKDDPLSVDLSMFSE